MPEGTKTTLSKATTTSPSLRTTVPAWIVEQFGLSPGDFLYWQLDMSGKAVRLVVEPSKK